MPPWEALRRPADRPGLTGAPTDHEPDAMLLNAAVLLVAAGTVLVAAALLALRARGTSAASAVAAPLSRTSRILEPAEREGARRLDHHNPGVEVPWSRQVNVARPPPGHRSNLGRVAEPAGNVLWFDDDRPHDLRRRRHQHFALDAAETCRHPSRDPRVGPVRDYETLPIHHEAMVHISMIMTMSRRLDRTGDW